MSSEDKHGQHGQMKLTFHLDGCPHPSFEHTFDLPPPASMQTLFPSILHKAGDLLGLTDVEGLYTSVGGYPVYRVAGLRNGASYAVRATEDCAMAKSLLPRTNREKALGIENTFPAWPNVEEGIKAKTELDLLIEEFKSNGGEEYLKESEEAKEMVDLGDLDIGQPHKSSWRNRLVKRGRRNWKRRKEGLKPIYNTDSESEGEKEDKEKHAGNQSDEEGSVSSDDSYSRANPVVKSTTEGFYDEYKRSEVLVDDPDWAKRYGEASSPLKKDVQDIHATDETGRIYNDVLEALRVDSGRVLHRPSEIIEAMRDAMKIAAPGEDEVEEGGRLDDFNRIVHPAGKTVGRGGSYALAGEAGYSNVAIYGLRALASITREDASCREEAFTYKGHRLAISCMMAHPTNRHVGRYGSLFLANICTKATQSTLCKAGAAKVLNERLTVNAECGEVCGAAIMGLYKLSEGGIYFICEKIIEGGGVIKSVKAVKKHTNNITVASYTVWLFKELYKAGLAEDVRRDEGLFAAGCVACRYYDNEDVRDAGIEVEALLMEGVDVETEAGRFYLRERDTGRAVGGGSCNDSLVIDILEKFPQQDRLEVLGEKEKVKQPGGGGDDDDDEEGGEEGEGEGKEDGAEAETNMEQT
ncbi:hypothetical protein TrST_g2682 [Triparma strigata]|uniref:Uncharacterized protein n=1 Tax=Triparma strigata TaxID=1606541 RepID=A0A9W7BVB4_9STRA|nr:hypothetical protein TrST_g2682 [Triparma strigata]